VEVRGGNCAVAATSPLATGRNEGDYFFTFCTYNHIFHLEKSYLSAEARFHMKPISDAGSVLRWLQTGRLDSQLLAGDELVASLRWTKDWSTQATGESSEGTWNFKRVGLLHPKVIARRPASDAEAATANLAWGGSAVIDTPNAVGLKLQPASFRRPEWTLTDSMGTRLMSLRRNLSWTGDSAIVTLEEASKSLEGFSLLSVLSWYLTLLVSYDYDGSAIAASVAAGAI
jgi:hypothetical protein